MQTLLLTGFEPFLKFKENPTGSAVEYFDGKEIGGFRIVGRVYPVEFKTLGAQAAEDIRQYAPDAIINLGLAGGRHTIDIERIAVNCMDGRPDNTGFEPDGEKIEESGPDGLFSTLPIKKIESALKSAAVPARISNSAGTYLCNMLMYKTLNILKRQQKDVKAGFIHVPAHHEIGSELNIPSWSQQDINDAVEHIIKNIK